MELVTSKADDCFEELFKLFLKNSLGEEESCLISGRIEPLRKYLREKEPKTSEYNKTFIKNKIILILNEYDCDLSESGYDKIFYILKKHKYDTRISII